MNENERKRMDKHEASGLLPALRARAKSFCAPLWWEVGGHTVLANGTMCLIATPKALFGVTNDHVLKAYETHREQHDDVFCQLGSGPFDPIPNLISRSEYWDLATFRIPELTLRHWGGSVFASDTWPPPAIRTGDTVMLGGFPANRRTTSAGPRPQNMFSDFVSFLARAENSSDDHMSFRFDSENWYWPQGLALDRYPDLSGASGGPCFRLVAENETIELVGFIYEAHPTYEIIRVRQACLIGANGNVEGETELLTRCRARKSRF